MKTLLKQIETYLDIDYEKVSPKLLGHAPKVNENIEIYWSDRETPDRGYTFRLPNQDQDDDMCDLCVHITYVNNDGGMDNSPQEWIHLLYLLNNQYVEKVKFNP